MDDEKRVCFMVGVEKLLVKFYGNGPHRLYVNPTLSSRRRLARLADGRRVTLNMDYAIYPDIVIYGEVNDGDKN